MRPFDPAFFVLALLGAVSVRADATTQLATAISDVQWSQLNQTVAGKLGIALPVSAPCFSVVDNKNVTTDVSACKAVQQGYTSPTWRNTRFGAYMLPQWETCQKKSQKCLLNALNTSDPSPLSLPCFQGSVPPFYIDVRDASDAQAAFAFAKKTGVNLAIKNGGHDYKGRSSGVGALGVWVHNLNSKAYDAQFKPQGCNATYNAITIGTGVPFQDIYEFADANNVTFIGGYHQTIAGGGGWVLGGGHSILTPVYGLGIDRVVEFKIVTPDGQLRVANECQNSDLFWALRGGGGGTFGIVLESSHRVEPKLSLVVASLKFPQTATNPLPFLRLVTDKALQWGQEGWGGHIGANMLINVNPLITLENAKASLADVANYTLSQNGTVVIEELPSWLAFFQKYVTSAQSAVGTENILGTRLMPTTLWNSDAGKDSVYNALVNMLPFANPYIVVGTPFLYDYPANSTSATPAWRNSLWHLGFHATWQYNNTTDEIAAIYKKTSQTTQTLRDLSPGSGAYFNEGDVYEPSHEESYWGVNYPALLTIKQKYDPDNLLDCWDCVGSRGRQDSRFQCYLDL
ncbi:FAD-binding domain-containing protein [Dentipellis sp. KUC8613]|nr:FAD-binding domain-containing protein [Dentipellis sp. KUC8613]